MRALILDSYDDATSAKHLSYLTGIPPSILSYHMRKEGIERLTEPGNGYTLWKEEAVKQGFDDEKQFFEYLLKDLTMGEIALYLGVNRNSVKSRISRHGLSSPIKSIKDKYYAYAHKCKNEKWRKYAIKFGFLSEQEMLKHFQWKYGELYKKLNDKENIHQVRERYYKYNLLPARRSPSSRRILMTPRK